ncbi:DMT family transporter [Butyrivibrio sp. WCD3002]|uniref:DMT family transporter n=1 Tax=Butyrivibrio sp. WCD3002 TaxID=1280676 RepID=UPI00040101F7|nr:DMT family transporter [Butyrivibrio sp. WCD3002]
MDKTNDQMKGIFFIIFATIGFSFMSFFIKLAGDLPTMQKAFFRNAFALIIAFMGALLIIRPTPGNMELVPALIGLYGGFGAGTAYAFVRKATGKGAATPVIVICFSLFSCMLTLPFMITNYKPMSNMQLLTLIAAGLSAAVGQFSITTAYKYAPAKKLSVFDYLQVIFAALWGILFLHEIPTLLSIIGYVVIIGVAVIRWHMTLQGSEGD